MPVVYPQYGPGLPGNPALDALRRLTQGNASPASGSRPQPRRLSESDVWGTPSTELGMGTKPGWGANLSPASTYPPPATPPIEQDQLTQIRNSLAQSGPAVEQAADATTLDTMTGRDRLRMGQPSIMARLQGPTVLQSSLPGSRS